MYRVQFGASGGFCFKVGSCVPKSQGFQVRGNRLPAEAMMDSPGKITAIAHSNARVCCGIQLGTVGSSL